MLLHVSNLSFCTSEDSLRSFFSVYPGICTVNIVRDFKTGRSRGFAFVGYESDVSAIKAMQDLQGACLDGRPLRISEAVDRPRGMRHLHSSAPEAGAAPEGVAAPVDVAVAPSANPTVSNGSQH